MSLTGEEVGYRDAIHQVVRALGRRLKAIHAQIEDAKPEEVVKLRARQEEVEHLISVIESLHR